MKNILNQIALLVLIVQLTDYNSVLESFKEHNVSIETKSILGWIRVLSDDEKTKQYHLEFIQDREKYIKTLMEHNQNKLSGKLK